MKKILITLICLLAAGRVNAAAEPARQAYKLMAGANSFYYTLQSPVEITLRNSDGADALHRLNLKLSGVILDKKNSTSTDNAFAADLGYNGNFLEGLTGETSLRVGVESKTKKADGNFFFRINAYPEIVDDFVNLSALRGRWVVGPLDELGSMGESFDPTGLLGNMITVAGETSVSPEDSLARQKQMENAFFTSRALQLLSNTPAVLPDGAPAIKSIIKVDKQGIMEYAVQAGKILGQPLDASQVKDLQQQLDYLTFGDLELTAGASAVRTVWNLSYKDTADSQQPVIKARIDLLVKNINDPKLKVVAPTGALSIDGVMAMLDGGTLTEARVKAQDARTISDVKQITTALEMYYNEAGDYPKAIAIGKPIAYGGNTYMEKVPAGSGQGKADPCNNIKYKYKYIKAGDYTLQYCLNGQVGSIPAGIKMATPSGIYDETKVKVSSAAIAKALNAQLALAEKQVMARHDLIAKSGNNVRISIQTDKEAKFIIQALDAYFSQAGQYPASLTSGKSLVYKSVSFIRKIPSAARYKNAVLCPGAKYEYTPIKSKGKVVDYKFRYCIESAPQFLGSSTSNSGWLTYTAGGLTQ